MRSSCKTPILFLLAVMAAMAAPAWPATAPTPAAPTAGPHRVELTGADGKPFPYTVEIPADWQIKPAPELKGAWLLPAGADPQREPRAILVRASPADLHDPEATVRTIQENDKQDDTWSAPLVAVREVGGVRGVLVQMNSGQGTQARSALTLKLPLGTTSVDLMASVPQVLFPTLRLGYEKILFSVRPAGK
ncbi:MAG TPA: hypothetical protein VFE33_02045 [Thermoanaerobaculia bacterium]|nr:hypothetical protein [Thermoanaerobaculia bacterium]